MGVFILWLGWFGFNPGSTGLINGDPCNHCGYYEYGSRCRAISAMALNWALFKKPDIGITLNGGLAGLVAITRRLQ